MSGLIIAAPASGSGKTTVTLALLRALHRRGIAAAPFKCGPDYIDPAFHTVAAARPCHNLDTWAMRADTVAALINAHGGEVNIAEGVMGLFDGAGVGSGDGVDGDGDGVDGDGDGVDGDGDGVDGDGDGVDGDGDGADGDGDGDRADGDGAATDNGDGSTASLARASGWPVVLVVDAAGMAQSAAALVAGFARHDPAVRVAGVVFNRTGGAAHNRMLSRACADVGVTVLGGIARNNALHLPSRHLGLVQAAEHAALENFLEAAADVLEASVSVDALLALASARSPTASTTASAPSTLPPPGQRIAVARDDAFSFLYAATVDSWRAAGSEVIFFSPLADETPDKKCDAVFLPGGYPELHAARLAQCKNFANAMHAAARRGATVMGECGGYMVLGRALTDADGARYEMLNLLPVETSFAQKKMRLGYRHLRLAADHALGKQGAAFRGHEFHFAVAVCEPTDTPLFIATDAAGRNLGGVGCTQGTVSGSFVHLVDRAR